MERAHYTFFLFLHARIRNLVTLLPLLCDFRILRTKYYMAFQNELLESLNVAFVLFLSVHVFLVTCSTHPSLDRNPGGSTYFVLSVLPFLLFQNVLISPTTLSRNKCFYNSEASLYLKTAHCYISFSRLILFQDI